MITIEYIIYNPGGKQGSQAVTINSQNNRDQVDTIMRLVGTRIPPVMLESLKIRVIKITENRR